MDVSKKGIIGTFKLRKNLTPKVKGIKRKAVQEYAFQYKRKKYILAKELEPYWKDKMVQVLSVAPISHNVYLVLELNPIKRKVRFRVSPKGVVHVFVDNTLYPELTYDPTKSEIVKIIKNLQNSPLNRAQIKAYGKATRLC